VPSGHQALDMKLGTFKLFSSRPIPDVWLSMLFDEGYDISHNLTWNAYPAFDPPENFPPFALVPGLYYTAALESAASAMEIAAIEGRNVALLCSQYMKERYLVQMF
jgi:prenylcysteine oxidase/farnesylcysteine lyase